MTYAEKLDNLFAKKCGDKSNALVNCNKPRIIQ